MIAFACRIAMTAVALLLCGGCTERDWIELKTTGKQDKPLPIIVVSSKEVAHEDASYRHALLQPARYLEFRRYIESYECRKDIGKERLEFGAYAVVSMRNSKARLLCSFNRMETCNFSTRAAAQFPEIKDALAELRMVLDCRGLTT